MDSSKAFYNWNVIIKDEIFRVSGPFSEDGVWQINIIYGIKIFSLEKTIKKYELNYCPLLS